MRRGWWIVLWLLLTQVAVVRAQALSEEYYRENPSWGVSELWASEDAVTLLPRSREPLFERFALYGFSFVGYDFRGESSLTESIRLGAVELREPLDRYADYSLVSLLRRAPVGREYLWSRSHARRGVDVRAEIFDPSPFNMKQGGRLSTRFATRTYTFGASCSVLGSGPYGWVYSLALGGRWGEDSAIEGLANNDEYLWLSGAKRWQTESGLTHRVQVALMAAPRVRSLRSWNTEEVFELAGNRYYNSYWGWQGSRRRSSREVGECVPTLYVAWDVDDNYVLSNANVTLLVRGGRRERTTLDWNGAPTPLPDYYGYLPSGLSDEGASQRAREVWLRGDERFTQIDWQSLYRANAISDAGSRYVVLAEREDVAGATLDASAGLLGNEGGRIGVRLDAHRSHNHNTPDDLLGSAGWNGGEGYDLYDYVLTHAGWQLYASWRGAMADGELSAAAELGGERLGYVGRHSQHQSQRGTTNFRSRLLWHKPLTDEWQLGTTMRYDHLAPFWEDVWGGAEGALSVNPYVGAVRTTAVELWSELSREDWSLQTTLYGRYEGNVAGVEHFWNDMNDSYSVLLAGGMERLAVGGEMSAQLKPSRSLTLAAHISLGGVSYVGDGVADVVRFDDGAAVASQVDLSLRGAAASSVPRWCAALEVRYFTPRGWLVGGEWAFVGGRRMEPSLLLRSDYVLSRDLSPEARRQCMATPSLGAANNLSMFVWKRWGSVTLSLSVRNVLNFRDAYYAGYQPSRLYVTEKSYANSYSPREARYQYVYPRSLLLTIGYEF